MSSDAILVLRGVGKSYPIYGAASHRLAELVAAPMCRVLGRAPPVLHEDHWAIRDITLEVGRGETVGIIGRNGSGKSTLLQVACGLLAADEGDVIRRARVAALLELGSGFNPEFTGRENALINAQYLGLPRRDAAARMAGIEEFADIGGFFDRPVKTYSSGMVVRLAFAVQAQVDPELLVVDEALAVGDVKFQTKCFERLRRLKADGAGILLVTHSSEQVVTHCDRAVLLDEGRIVEAGEPRDVVHRYLDLMFGAGTPRSEVASPAALLSPPRDGIPVSTTEDRLRLRRHYNPHEFRWGDGAATIVDACILSDDGAEPTVVHPGQSLRAFVSVRFMAAVVRPILGITVKTKEGVTVWGTNTEMSPARAFSESGETGSVIVMRCDLNCHLGTGDYFVSLGVASRQGDQVVPHDRRYDALHLPVGACSRLFGIADLEGRFEVVFRQGGPSS